ncbi:helix-turn-helix domain-containing protein [Cohnella zeiphila]|uniref:Helix-turn-helix domain-containing protein n=1 Tax=Cohnella zeiphila TaxID=2761120 RepID=A0A7X0SMA0_9BACL|nr:helix-turn-helix domain-containing protein [Cohnella zeiphila]MBB6732617.1 helix-turn-helix domain-containing protein [Cohnella zeiphila]
MENQKWYRRLHLTYLIILLVSGAVIASIVFNVVYGNLVQENEKASRAYTQRVADSVASSLKNIELTLAARLVGNEAVDDFFNGGSADPQLAEYKASLEISDIRNNPMIYSAYFYRYKDGKVLTGGYAAKLDDFSDKPFVLGASRSPGARWSPVRGYTEYPLIDPPERVVSIVKKRSGNEGLVVLNVKADRLLSAAGALRSDPRFRLAISDGTGQTIYSAGGSSGSKRLAELTNDYTGWRYEGGMAEVGLFEEAVLRSLMPLAIVFLSLAAIYACMAYIARRNLRPLEKIVRQFTSSHQEARTEAAGGGLRTVERAVDAMLDRVSRADRQQAENVRIKRKQFFFDLMEEEEEGLSAPDWREYAKLFGLGGERCALTIAILEIDRYVPLLRRDREALLDSKRRLGEAAARLQNGGAGVVALDWISGDRLALLLKAELASDLVVAASEHLLNELLERAERELAFTVTVGLGTVAGSLAEAAMSFREALSALQYKMTAGNNRMIVYREIRDMETGIDSRYFKWLEDLIHHFRIPVTEWKSDFAKIFDHLEDRVLKNEEMQLLLNYFTHRFAREMEEISPEISGYWHAVTFPLMTGALRETGAVAEIRPLYEALIEELYGKYAAMLESGDGNRVVYEARKYIEEEYANPDLSLSHLSDRFGINGKYLSQLFKDEFGVKFVDFLIGLRISQSQKLLRDTELSVNEISRRVGYEHAISFGRVFKKSVGVSPGDYRKAMRPAGDIRSGAEKPV